MRRAVLLAVRPRVHPGGAGRRPRASPHPPVPTADWQREADRVALGEYAPPGILVTEDLDILQFRGRHRPYLQPAPGEPSFNLLKMAREGLYLEVRRAVEECRQAGGPRCAIESVRGQRRRAGARRLTCGSSRSSRPARAGFASSSCSRSPRPPAEAGERGRPADRCAPSSGRTSATPSCAGSSPSTRGLPPVADREARRRERGAESRRTRRSSPATRSCRAPTRRWRRPRRSCSRSTRS